MAEFYLTHTSTGRSFKVMHVDKEKGTIRLRGANGGIFEEPYDPAGFKERGYTLDKVEDPEHAE